MNITTASNARTCWLLACLGCVGLACAARLYHVTHAVLWLDEAYSVTLASMPLAQIILHTARDVHPPLYYLLLHFWMDAFGNSLLAVRGMSVFFGCLTVAVAIRITTLLATRSVALIAGILLALLPVAVRYSQEARMYALTGFLLLAATLMLMHWAIQPGRLRYLFGYGLLMTAALYSHYFSMLAVASHWLYVLLCNDKHGKQLIYSRAWWICNVLIAFGYVPWLPSLWGQLGHTEWVSWVPKVTLQTLPSTLWLFFALGAGEDYSHWLFWLTPLVIVGASLSVVASDRHPSKPTALILSTSYVPLLLAWLGSYSFSLYMIRYLSFAANGMPILMALSLARFAARTRVWLLALLVCLTWQGVGLNRLYNEESNLNGWTDWRRIRLDVVVDKLNQQWQVGDVIVVDGAFWYYTVQYYNKAGREVLIYQEGEQADNSGRLASSFGWRSLYYPKSEQILIADVNTLTSRFARIWWVGVGADPSVGQRLPNTWHLKEILRGGLAHASLFILANPGVPQAAASLCGSKLSARAICHMRE